MNSTIFIQAVLLGIASAIVSVSVIVIMAQEQILNWWFRFGYWIGVDRRNGKEHTRWFYRPIWGCEKCFAGQLSLWVYICLNLGRYSFVGHVLSIACAIVSAVVLSYFINHIKNNQ